MRKQVATWAKRGIVPPDATVGRYERSRSSEAPSCGVDEGTAPKPPSGERMLTNKSGDADL